MSEADHHFAHPDAVHRRQIDARGCRTDLALRRHKASSWPSPSRTEPGLSRGSLGQDRASCAVGQGTLPFCKDSSGLCRLDRKQASTHFLSWDCFLLGIWISAQVSPPNRRIDRPAARRSCRRPCFPVSAVRLFIHVAEMAGRRSEDRLMAPAVHRIGLRATTADDVLNTQCITCARWRFGCPRRSPPEERTRPVDVHLSTASVGTCSASGTSWSFSAKVRRRIWMTAIKLTASDGDLVSGFGVRVVSSSSNGDR